MNEETLDGFEDEPTAAAKPKAKSRSTKSAASKKKAVIVIHKDTRPHAVDPVPVALNGVQYTIRRGVEVEIPVELLEVLDQAEEVRFEQVVNTDHSVTMVPRKALSYPYQVIRRL